MLGKLEESGEPAVSLYLPLSVNLEDMQAHLNQVPAIGEYASEIIKSSAGKENGTVLFWGKTYKLQIIPPFPIKDKFITNGYDTEVLRSMLGHDYLIGILLVRLGNYSLGVCQGENLVEHNTGTGLVHGRQRQGGSSSNRFRRRREEQAFHFLDRVGIHSREMFEPYARKFDYFVYGGARTTILELRKQIDFLKQFDSRVLPPLLDIPDPHYEVLKKAVTDIHSSRVTEWREE